MKYKAFIKMNGRLRLGDKAKQLPLLETIGKYIRKVRRKNSPEVRPDFGLLVELGQPFGWPESGGG